MTATDGSDTHYSAEVEAPLYVRIADILSGDIGAGRIPPGERLLESRVARRFGVSRAPSRQALARLLERGVLKPVEDGARGYVVAGTPTERPSERGAATETGPLSTVPAWRRIHGQVEEAIIARIAFGSWRVGEAAIGRHHGVSRTVAREVLARLQADGLVNIEGKRWIAPEMTPGRVEELYTVRSVLEPAALPEAAARLERGRLIRMRETLRQAASGCPDGEALDRLEGELHVGLLSLCPNRTLRRAITQHQSLLLAHRFFYRWTAKLYDTEPFLAEHLDVLDALAAGQVDAAAARLREHLLASRSRAADRIAQVRHLVTHDPLDYLDRV